MITFDHSVHTMYTIRICVANCMWRKFAPWWSPIFRFGMCNCEFLL